MSAHTPPFPVEPFQASREVFHVEIRHFSEARGVRVVFSEEVGPEFVLGCDHQIRGIMREVGARYFWLMRWDYCRIADPRWCHAKGKQWSEEELRHVDFDHINGDYLDHRVGNLQPACSSCNSHKQRKSASLPPTSQRERDPRAVEPTSGETATSWAIYPKAVADAFHPLTGRLAKAGMSVLKHWYVNNLPDVVGRGRATTYGKYVSEWVSQGYLTEEASAEGVKLVRTGKSAAKLLKRELGLEVTEC